MQTSTRTDSSQQDESPGQQDTSWSFDAADKPVKRKNNPSKQPKPADELSPFQLVLLTVAIFLFAQLIIGIIIAVYAVVTGQGETVFETITDSNLNNFLIVAALAVIQFAGIYFVLWRYGLSLRSIGLVRPQPRDVPRALAAWGIYMALTIVAVGALQIFDIGIDFEQEQVIDFAPAVDLAGKVLVFASLVLAPAFIEEVLMRGFLFMGLRNKLSFARSTAIVSFLFGAAHLQIGTGEPLLWAAFVDTFVLSVVLCGLTEKYKSIWPAIFVHGIKNGIAFVYLFVL